MKATLGLYPYWEVQNELTEMEAIATLAPLCKVIPDRNFFLATGYVEIADEVAVSNVAISKARLVTNGINPSLLFIVAVREGSTKGLIGDEMVDLRAGDYYVISPNLSWDLAYEDVRHQSLVLPLKGSLHVKVSFLEMGKNLEALLDLISWESMVNISKSKFGREFVVASIFGCAMSVDGFPPKTFLKALKNTHFNDMYIKQVAADLNCSVAAVSQVRIGENLSIAKWFREINKVKKMKL